MTEERILYIALNTVPGLKGGLFHRALEQCGNAERMLQTGEKLSRIDGIGPSTARAVASLAPEKAWEGEERTAAGLGISIRCLLDDDYPAMLKKIPDPPPVLYCQGEFHDDDDEGIAVIGSRKATTYGRLTAEKLSRDLAARGVTVISGMARGIDSCAHRGAIEGGGRTIAVLGTGLDRLYPPENRSLAGKIAERGAVVTEFPFRAGPEKWHFPLRNRVISGLSLGVVVVEAAARSGALITSDIALEQGKEVLAVPGNITSPASAGTNRLIREGARLVENAEDILEEFPRLAERKKAAADERPRPQLSAEEKELLSRLEREPLPIDEVIRRSPTASSRTVSLLTTLELKGMVRQFAGKRFVRHGP